MKLFIETTDGIKLNLANLHFPKEATIRPKIGEKIKGLDESIYLVFDVIWEDYGAHYILSKIT